MIIVVDVVKLFMIGIEIKFIMKFKWRSFIDSKIILVNNVKVIINCGFLGLLYVDIMSDIIVVGFSVMFLFVLRK